MSDRPRDRDRHLGATIGARYRLVRRIGVGSMGRVYEAHRVSGGPRVAVKVVNGDESEEVLARFAREARIASRIESEHIVKMIDAGIDPEHGPYLVSEYLVGEDLATRLARERTTSPRLAVHIAEQLARGLARAHVGGVIHRDVKPANVFLTHGSDDAVLAKLLDFGVSKLRTRDATCITAVGMAVGTPRYMSPEQIEGVEEIDARTDVWGLSCVLYEMLAGRPAFLDAPTAIDVMLRILRAPVDPIAQVAPWVPLRLAEVVDAGLQRDREHRISDATTFAQLLIEAMPGAFADGRGRVAPRLSTIPAPYAFEDQHDDDPPPVSDVEVQRWLGDAGARAPARKKMKA